MTDEELAVKTTDDVAFRVEPGAGVEGAGVFEIVVSGAGSYVGGSNNLSRRLREYEANTRRHLSGETRARGFRDIHDDLAKAWREGRPITFRVLEHCSAGELPQRREHWVEQRGTLNVRRKR